MQSLKQSLITDELDAVERGRPNRNSVSPRALGASIPATHNGRAAHPSRERPVSKDFDADEREAEEQQVLQRRIRQPLWSLDRGTGYYQQERVKHKKASLLETGRFVSGFKCSANPCPPALPPLLSVLPHIL